MESQESTMFSKKSPIKDLQRRILFKIDSLLYKKRVESAIKKAEKEKKGLIDCSGLSKDLIHTLKSIDSKTGLPEAENLNKVRIALALGPKIEENETLRNLPGVYFAANTDIEFPLALGLRKIYLVDDVLRNEKAIEEIRTKLGRIRIDAPQSIVQSAKESNTIFQFPFNFGRGQEQVEINIIPKLAEQAPPPAKCGVLYSYLGLGESPSPFFNYQQLDQLTIGGFCFDDRYNPINLLPVLRAAKDYLSQPESSRPRLEDNDPLLWFIGDPTNLTLYHKLEEMGALEKLTTLPLDELGFSLATNIGGINIYQKTRQTAPELITYLQLQKEQVLERYSRLPAPPTIKKTV